MIVTASCRVDRVSEELSRPDHPGRALRAGLPGSRSRQWPSLVLGVSALASMALGPSQAPAAEAITIVSFDGTNGRDPDAALIADADGNLFGTTYFGGAYDLGTVFMISKTANGYASAPTSLVSFDGTGGIGLIRPLLADVYGNLYGTTVEGGAFGDGTAFKIAKTASGYASTPTTLVNFDGIHGARPFSELIADTHGNLFGTTLQGGAYNEGTVFEIAKIAGGYAPTPTTLVSFDGANGAGPFAGLIIDTQGNLFGTTQGGGAYGMGTVFEVAKTAGGYNSAPRILVSFDGANGDSPRSTLTADGDGNLFGTTEGGAHGAGTIFELAKSADGYASAPTILVSFNVDNGYGPHSPLLLDANGSLYGTTGSGGPHIAGTVFRIDKTASGYASTPTTLIDVGGSALLADRSGNLLGTAGGGEPSAGCPNGCGTVFKITGSGFVVPGKKSHPTKREPGGLPGTNYLALSSYGINATSNIIKLSSGLVTSWLEHSTRLQSFDAEGNVTFEPLKDGAHIVAVKGGKNVSSISVDPDTNAISLTLKDPSANGSFSYTVAFADGTTRNVTNNPIWVSYQKTTGHNFTDQTPAQSFSIPFAEIFSQFTNPNGRDLSIAGVALKEGVTSVVVDSTNKVITGKLRAGVSTGRISITVTDGVTADTVAKTIEAQANPS